jgi:hypothetical protein
MDKKEKE